MAQQKRKQKYYTYFIGAVFLFALLLGGQKFSQEQEEVSQMAGFFAPVMGIARQPILFYNHLKNEMSAYFFAVDVNKKLRIENAALQGWQSEALYLRHENKKLKMLLDMAKEHQVIPVAGRILADTRSPYARTVLIDVGHDKGVTKGQAVLAEGGLAGRVLAVAKNAARVLLLGDYNTRIPVKLLQSGTLAIVKGGRYRTLDLILTEGPIDEIKIGEEVITSGIGGVFAPGIPVGVVHSIKENTVQIQPYVDFAKLDKILVHRRPVFGVIGSLGKGGE